MIETETTQVIKKMNLTQREKILKAAEDGIDAENLTEEEADRVIETLYSFKAGVRESLKKNYKNDEHFGSMSCQFLATDPIGEKKFLVKIFPIKKWLSFGEAKAFLKMKGSILLGDKGIDLIRNYRNEKIPMGFIYSLDYVRNLSKDKEGILRLSCLNTKNYFKPESRFFVDGICADAFLSCFIPQE
jgi:hypothetical protein